MSKNTEDLVKKALTESRDRELESFPSDSELKEKYPAPRAEDRLKTKPRGRRSHTISALAATAACLVLVIVFGHFAPMGRHNPVDTPQIGEETSRGNTETEEQTTSETIEHPPLLAHLVSAAEYPEYIPRPDFADYGESKTTEYYAALSEWKKAWSERNALYSGMSTGLEAFLSDTVGTYVSETGGENRVISPMSIYFAMGMLSETAEGETLTKILTTLGAESKEELRSDCFELWNTMYRNDKTVSVLLNNSMWLSNRYSYVQETADALSKYHFASSFVGQMGSEEYNKLYREWINENTGGLLKDFVNVMELPAETAMSLINTVDFKAEWSAFYDTYTFDRPFYTPDGEVMAPQMSGARKGLYYGEKFMAIKLKFSDEGYAMWFFLPDEGVTPEELSLDGEVMALMLHGKQTEDNYRQDINVNYFVPRFDMSCETDLEDGLIDMGLEKLFDRENTDFNILSNSNMPVYVSSILNRTRLKIDEDGCEGASLTEILLGPATSTRPPDIDVEEINLVFNRPFLVAVVNNHTEYEDNVLTVQDSLPLFVGIVNDPTENK